MMRQRGMPPTPRAMSRASDPVGTNCMSSLTGWSPRRMTLPLPNWRSICVTAASRALSLSKVALLSCSGRGKYCQGSVHGAGPLQEATIQDDADDTKLRYVDVLQGKWVTRTAKTGDGEMRPPGASLSLEEPGSGQRGRHVGLQARQRPVVVDELQRHDAFGAAQRQEDGLRDGHLTTLYEHLRERLGEPGHARRRHHAEERQRDVQRVVEAQHFVALERPALPGLDGAPRLVGEVAGDEQPKRVVVAHRVHPAISRRSRWSAVETL